MCKVTSEVLMSDPLLTMCVVDSGKCCVGDHSLQLIQVVYLDMGGKDGERSHVTASWRPLLGQVAVGM